MKTLIAAVAFTTAVAAPAFAQSNNVRAWKGAFAAPASTSAYSAYAASSSVTASRAQAIQECNIGSGKLTQYTWGVTQLQVYRACMAQHGQQE
jgi:hypothetical protein